MLRSNYYFCITILSVIFFCRFINFVRNAYSLFKLFLSFFSDLYLPSLEPELYHFVFSIREYNTYIVYLLSKIYLIANNNRCELFEKYDE